MKFGSGWVGIVDFLFFSLPWEGVKGSCCSFFERDSVLFFLLFSRLPLKRVTWVCLKKDRMC